MAKTRSTASAAAEPKTGPAWWIAGDDEECRHCDHGYAYETEVRCVDCDEPLCALCARLEGGRRLCPDCAGGGDR